MPKAVVLGDGHKCPKVEPGPKPHVGGPVAGPGASSVLIDNKPAAVQGDKLVCISPMPDSICKGIASVLIEGKPAADSSAKTAHGGSISSNSSVEIG